MTLPIRLTSEAIDDLEHAVRWYEDRGKGLGAAFLAAVDRTLDSIAPWPAQGGEGVETALQPTPPSPGAFSTGLASGEAEAVDGEELVLQVGFEVIGLAGAS